MKSKITKTALLILVTFCLTTLAAGQGRDLSEYIDKRKDEAVKARIDETDPTKQSNPPAATGNSTSLVERSSAPDLFGLGMDFLKLSDSSTDKKSATPKSITFSAYALKSLFANEDPLDPAIYNRNRKWRSVSFTLGYDVPENTDDREPIIGIKWLAFNGRDVSSSRNQTQIHAVETALGSGGIAFNQIQREVTVNLFASLKNRGALPAGVTKLEEFETAVADQSVFPGILTSLTEDEKKAIDATIAKRLSAFVNLQLVTRNAVKTIRSRPQLALQFLTTQRKGIRPDEYSGLVSYDKGMGANSISLNGSFLYKNNRIGKDSKGGTFSAAIHMPLRGFRPLDYKDPLLLSIEAVAAGATGESPKYTAQAKLTIPLLPGFDLPISVSVANRSEFIKETEVRGRFGFTFDISKALKAFRDNFQPRP